MHIAHMHVMGSAPHCPCCLSIRMYACLPACLPAFSVLFFLPFIIILDFNYFACIYTMFLVPYSPFSAFSIPYFKRKIHGTRADSSQKASCMQQRTKERKKKIIQKTNDSNYIHKANCTSCSFVSFDLSFFFCCCSCLSYIFWLIASNDLKQWISRHT